MKAKMVVTFQAELNEREYEAIRLLSNRIREHEMYIGGDAWRDNVVQIIGEGLTTVLENMFKSQEAE